MREVAAWRRFLYSIATGLVVVLTPGVAFAQASIAGVVRDASGAVLPGVTVEASSPALIEKVRTVVTDGGGQYRVVDLRPGTYVVTFTLAGFTTVRRDGLVLSGDFVANVDAELRVGSVEETVTVTGAAPLVETRATRQQSVIDNDTLAAIPTGRSHYHVATLIAGMQTGVQDVGGSAGVQVTGAGSIHGATSGRLMQDGMSVGHNGESLNMWVSNVGSAAETVISTSGGLGEAETGGVVINVISRDGGNTPSGQVFYSFANSSMQGSNFTDELRTAGLRIPNSIDRVYDFNPTFGGKIIQDKLWYFLTHRNVGAYNNVAGMFYNKNAGNVNSWTYDPDTARPAVDGNHYTTGSVRLTWQATSKNKFAVNWDEQHRCVQCGEYGGTATQSPEASGRSDAMPTRVYQATWQSPATNRILLEAGYSAYMQRWGNRPRNDGTANPQLIQVTEQATGLTFRSPGNYGHHWTGIQNWRAALSYVTGSHSMKIGYLDAHQAPIQNEYTDPHGISNMRVLNGVPNQITQYANRSYQGISRPFGLYIQDQWTLGRMTLQGAIRYDYSSVNFSGGDQVEVPTVKAGPFFSTPVEIRDEGLKGQRYHDITPRMGMAYDLFGTGKTAVKVTLGKYMETVPSVTGGASNNPLTPVSRLAVTVNRAFTDNDRDFAIDCDLMNPGAQSPATTGSVDTCGPISDRRFGTAIPSLVADREAFEGWGNRMYNWEFGANIQHEVVSGLSVNVGYFRRWFGNFLVTDNLAVTAADFDAFSITAPVDPRLPNGGGYVIDGLLNVNPAKFGLVDQVVTMAKNYGEMSRRWQGVDITANLRMTRATFQGGVSIGSEARDECEIAAALPESAPSWSTNSSFSVIPFCSWATPYQPQVKGLGAYTIPGIEVQVSATFQSLPGLLQNAQTSVPPVGLSANFNASNAAVQPTLGRPLAGGAANITVNLLEPAAMYGERTNQIDFRVAKLLTFRGTRTQIGLDIYNLTNSNAIQSYNQTYGTAWLRPNSILTARFAKISAQLSF